MYLQNLLNSNVFRIDFFGFALFVVLAWASWICRVMSCTKCREFLTIIYSTLHFFLLTFWGLWLMLETFAIIIPHLPKAWFTSQQLFFLPLVWLGHFYWSTFRFKDFPMSSLFGYCSYQMSFLFLWLNFSGVKFPFYLLCLYWGFLFFHLFWECSWLLVGTVYNSCLKVFDGKFQLLGHFFISIRELYFLLWAEVFLVLCILNYFGFYPGHFEYYVVRPQMFRYSGGYW